jgi:hypothetical protein
MSSFLVDFSEIPTPEHFENFVYEFIKRRQQVKSINRTGRGVDGGADIVFEYEETNPFLESLDLRKGIIECKHNAKSGKAVGKNDIRIVESMNRHGAELFILATSTTASSTIIDEINSINKNKKDYKNQKATLYDAHWFSMKLIQEDNQDLLSIFFPESFKKYKEIESIKLNSQKQIREKIESQLNKFDKHMETSSSLTVHFINGLKVGDIQENLLRSYATKQDIKLQTSCDIEEEWIWSIDKDDLYDISIKKVSGSFALVTSKNYKLPNVWLEIEKSRSIGNLKVIFIEESLYKVKLLSEYPCVLLKDSLDSTLLGFQEYYRNTKHKTFLNENLFWLAIDIIASYYNSLDKNKC